MSIITLKDVYKTKGKQLTFGKINLDLSLNQIVSIVGPKGSGKSTFLNLLSGVDSFFNGDIFIDNHLIDEHTKSIISYCPSVIMLDIQYKVKKLIKLFKSFYKDFNEEKTIEFLAKNSIDINKKLGAFMIQDQYLIQLILILGRQSPIYLIDDLFVKLNKDKINSIVETIKEYSSRSLIILTTDSFENTAEFSNLFLFFKEGKLLSLITNEELHEKKSVNSYSWEVFTNV